MYLSVKRLCEKQVSKSLSYRGRLSYKDKTFVPRAVGYVITSPNNNQWVATNLAGKITFIGQGDNSCLQFSENQHRSWVNEFKKQLNYRR